MQSRDFLQQLRNTKQLFSSIRWDYYQLWILRRIQIPQRISQWQHLHLKHSNTNELNLRCQRIQPVILLPAISKYRFLFMSISLCSLVLLRTSNVQFLSSKTALLSDSIVSTIKSFLSSIHWWTLIATCPCSKISCSLQIVASTRTHPSNERAVTTKIYLKIDYIWLYNIVTWLEVWREESDWLETRRLWRSSRMI